MAICAGWEVLATSIGFAYLEWIEWMRLVGKNNNEQQRKRI